MKERSNPSARAQKNTTNLSHLSLKLCVELGEDLITWVCLELNARALVSSWKVENLDGLNVGVVGGIYSPNHRTSRLVEAAVAWRTGQSGAPPDSVRCASHVTWPLGSDRWSSDLWARLAVQWCTGQVL
jgi:hypothetical protein